MQLKTVKYLSAVSLNERVTFLKLLFRWQFSVWKLLWADFLWFFLIYISITLLYRLYLIKDLQKKIIFESIVAYMNKAAALVPLSFLLGFFVSTVLGRFWTIINSIPWMSKPAFLCQAVLNGDNEMKSRNLRMTIIRYLNLSWVLCMMRLSDKVRRRFWIKKEQKTHNIFNKKSQVLTIRERLDKINSDEMIKKYFGKLIMEEEIKVLEGFDEKSTKPQFFMPLMWATKLVERARKADYIKSDSTCSSLVNMIQDMKNNMDNLAVFNTFNVPLVYTQVIIIVVYTFLISEIFSQQTINNPNVEIESYFPIFSIFKFFIYMGWFKVGLTFINPFGSDDTDLPLDDMLDYNLQVSAVIARANDSCFPEYLTSSVESSVVDQLETLEKFEAERSVLQTNYKQQQFGNKSYEDMFINS